MSMRKRNHDFLRANVAELDRLLAATPESAVITRKSLEYRRSHLEAQLNASPPPARWPATAALTFSGKPVVDSSGVYADFAGTAVRAFTAAVTSLAASLYGPLPQRGMISNKENYQIMVTGTLPGSFGFELEEVADPQTDMEEESRVELALGEAKGILESLVSDDEAVAEAIGDTDPRALNDVRGFLKVMADHEAYCALSFRSSAFRFVDNAQVRRSLARIHEGNIVEAEDEMLGHFQGFLPNSRRAEFVVEESQEVLSCRVHRDAEEGTDINETLNRPMIVKMRSRSVGESRPRFTVTRFEPQQAS